MGHRPRALCHCMASRRAPSKAHVGSLCAGAQGPPSGLQTSYFEPAQAVPLAVIVFHCWCPGAALGWGRRMEMNLKIETVISPARVCSRRHQLLQQAHTPDWDSFLERGSGEWLMGFNTTLAHVVTYIQFTANTLSVTLCLVMRM